MLPNATKQSDTDLRTRDATVPTTPEQQRGGLPAWALEIKHPEGDACREIQAIRRASLSNNRSRMSNSPSVGSPCGVAGAATGSAKRVAVVGRLKTGSVEKPFFTYPVTKADQACCPVHAARKADQDDDNDDSSSDESILALIAAIRQNKRCNIGFSPSPGPVNPGIEAFTHLVQSSPLPSHKSNPSQGLPPLALTEINGQATLFTPREPLFPSSPSLPISMSISSAVHWSSPRFDNVSRRLFTAKEFSGSSPPEFRRSGIHLRENPDKMDVNKESSGPDNRANEIHVSTGMRIHFTGGVATVQLSQPEQSQISRAQDQVAQLAVVSSNQQWANIQTQPAQTPSVAAQVKQPIHAVDDQTVQAAQPAALPVQDPQSASENKDTDKEFDNNTTGEEPADVVEEDEEYNPAIDILLADIRNLQCSEAYKIPRAILTAAAQLAPLKDGTDKLDAEAQVLDFNPNLDDANHLIAAQNLLNKRSVHPDQLPLADLGPETFNDPNFFNSLPIGLPLPDLPAAQASQKAGLTLGDPSVLDQLEPIHVDLLSLLSPDNLDQPMIDLEEAVQGNKYPVIMDPAKGHGYVWLPRDKEGRSEPGWRKWPWDPLLPPVLGQGCAPTGAVALPHPCNADSALPFYMQALFYGQSINNKLFDSTVTRLNNLREVVGASAPS